MSRLYLRCVLCGRQQANGLLSGAAWGLVELPPGAIIHHPAVSDSNARACPSCMGDPNWEEHALTALGLAPDSGFSRRVDSG